MESEQARIKRILQERGIKPINKRGGMRRAPKKPAKPIHIRSHQLLYG